MSSTAVLNSPGPRAVNGRESGAWLGIDIGSSAIKLAQVSRHRDHWTLSVSHLLPVGSRPLDRLGLDRGMFLELFRERLARMARPVVRDVACVLSAALIGLHTLELPVGSPQEIRQMVSAELASLGESETEFGLFENTGSGASASGLVQYTVVSLPTSTAGVVAENLWQLGYACQAIDGLPCIHARAACLADREAHNETIGILDWGAASPVLTVVSRGRPVFTRILRDCGLNDAIGPVAQRIRFEVDELHELLMAYGQSQELGPMASARSGEILRDLADRCLQRMDAELQRTLRFLQRQGKDVVPSRLIVLGGGALLPSVAERLTELVHRPTSVWRLPGGRRKEDSSAIQALFASAIAASTLGAG